MSTLVRAALLMALGAGAAACGTARAAVPVERPALEVPPVPPRNVEPVLLPAAPPPEPVPDLPPPTSTTARAKPAPPATAKPDPKAEPPPAAEPVAPPPAPTPPLRTPGTPDADEATRRVREISRRAQNILENTDYGLLSRERKAQYDNAKLLISQTDAAIKVSNFEFARNLAEKAERLAKELQGR